MDYSQLCGISSTNGIDVSDHVGKNEFDPSNPEIFYSNNPQSIKDYCDYWYDDSLQNVCLHDVAPDHWGGCSGQRDDGRCTYRVDKVPCPSRIIIA